MIKMILVGGAAIAALIIGGVLEVKVHPEQLGQAPGRVMAFVTKPETLSKVRLTFTDLKRQAEQAITKDEKRRLELALLYVESDAKALQEMREKGDTSAEKVVPQAELLAKSMERVKEQVDSASIESLLEVKEKSRTALGSARDALVQLQAEREKYETLKDRFAKATQLLEKSFEGMVRPSGESEVAGTRDEKSASPSSVPINAVPANL